MRIMALALGGCIKAPPIDFGITEDTGGHITYALGSALGLAGRDDVTSVELVTRLIDDERLGTAYAVPYEVVTPKLTIRRIATASRAYLAKEQNVRDRPAFTRALIASLERTHSLPDVIHAHFADAAEVAFAIRERFGVPVIYTPHSLGIDKAQRCPTRDPDMTRRIALETRAISKADAVIGSSRDEVERQLAQYEGSDPARNHQVSPGASMSPRRPVDLDRARSLVAPFLRDPHKPILLAVARPVEKKNLGGLVDLFAAHAALRSRMNLIIVAGQRDGLDSGAPEQQAVIRGLVERMDRHDLYGVMALPKRHATADIDALYALTHHTGGVFANPAWTEPYGLTLTEAATFGVPVVATSHGGPADIVARLRHGLVADPADGAQFADAIHSLVNDRAAWLTASRRGLSGSRKLDWGTYAERFVGIAKACRIERGVRRPVRNLLLSDIDNTLTGCRRGAGELAHMLTDQRDLGFGAATGRSLQEARRLLEEWRYPEPDVLVTSVGSEIYWRDGGQLTADHDFAQHIAANWERNAITAALADLPEVPAQPDVEQRKFKLSYFAADERMATMVRDRLDAAGLPARVIFSHGRFLDVLPQRAGKGAAMRWVARKLGVPLGRVHAAGDSGNDFDMLVACPNAIVVANHDSALSPLIDRPSTYLSIRPHAGGVFEAMTRVYVRQQAA